MPLKTARHGNTCTVLDRLELRKMTEKIDWWAKQLLQVVLWFQQMPGVEKLETLKKTKTPKDH